MSQPYIGEIRPFGFNFAPRGWAECAGQLLQISQNTALFSLIGTTYGGDGRTTFALPDLRDRAPVGSGRGPGLSDYALGEIGGTTTVTLTTSELPAHTHAPQVAATGTDRNPFPIPAAPGGRWGGSDHGQYAASSPDVNMASGLVGSQGGGQAHTNESPYLAITYCIALQGLFPSRS